MANVTKAQLIEINAAQQAQIDKLTEMVAALTKGNTKQQAKPEKTLLDECPEYATAAQREQYMKTAKRAMELLPAVTKACGTKSVKAFVPVSKRYQNRLPHTIEFKATYTD